MFFRGTMRLMDPGKKLKRTLEKMRNSAIKPPDMTMDEINAVIAEVRRKYRKKEAQEKTLARRNPAHRR